MYIIPVGSSCIILLRTLTARETRPPEKWVLTVELPTEIQGFLEMTHLKEMKMQTSPKELKYMIMKRFLRPWKHNAL